MLHLRPDLVHMDRAAAGNTSPAGELMEAMRSGGVRAVSPNGVLGDPTGATERHGRSVFGMWVASLSSRVHALLREPER
jgi:creatinine amidohydrolase